MRRLFDTDAIADKRQTEEFFAERRNRTDRDEFMRILNRVGGEPPRPEDEIAAL